MQPSLERQRDTDLWTQRASEPRTASDTARQGRRRRLCATKSAESERVVLSHSHLLPVAR